MNKVRVLKCSLLALGKKSVSNNLNEKNDFVEVSKNLARYRSKNNLDQNNYERSYIMSKTA